jgi:hypothetical protein
MKSHPPKLAYPAIVLLLFTFLLSGCLTPAKVDGWIAEEYPSTPLKPKTSDYISAKTVIDYKSTISSTTHREKNKILPLLVYWRTESALTSTLSESVPFNIFNSNLISYANSKHLKDKLKGQKVELTVEKLPTSFSWTGVDHIIFLGIWYVEWSAVFIEPHNENMVVSYRVLNDNTETKKGTIAIRDLNQRTYLKMFHYSGKKFLDRYLEAYNSNLQMMSRQFVDQLMSEL